jgi:hypothetical protein
LTDIEGLKFSLFLSCYCPKSKASTAQVYAEMQEMAQAAEQLGYCGLKELDTTIGLLLKAGLLERSILA